MKLSEGPRESLCISAANEILHCHPSSTKTRHWPHWPNNCIWSLFLVDRQNDTNFLSKGKERKVCPIQECRCINKNIYICVNDFYTLYSLLSSPQQACWFPPTSAFVPPGGTSHPKNAATKTTHAISVSWLSWLKSLPCASLWGCQETASARRNKATKLVTLE